MRRSRVTGWVALAALLVPVVMSAVLWRLQADRVGELEAAASTDRDALMAATRETLALSTIDYRKTDEYVAAVKQGTTGAFLAEFEKTEEQAITFIKQNRSVQVPSIPKDGAALLERRGGEARLLVAMDVQVSNRAIKTPQPRQYRLQVTMTKVGARWLISDLEPVDAPT